MPLRLLAWGFLVFQNSFAFNQPGYAKRHNGNGFKPESWLKPVHQGFDRRQRGDSNQADTTQDYISAYTIDCVSLELPGGRCFGRVGLREQLDGEVGQRQEEQRRK